MPEKWDLEKDRAFIGIPPEAWTKLGLKDALRQFLQIKQELRDIRKREKSEWIETKGQYIREDGQHFAVGLLESRYEALAEQLLQTVGTQIEPKEPKRGAPCPWCNR